MKQQWDSILMRREWAMPNKLTFTIPPIKRILEVWLKDCKIIVDPFANSSKIGTVRNDLNPEFGTEYNLDALSFLKQLPSGFADAVLYDPPYSISQASECYRSFGKERLSNSVANMGYWADCKSEVARILKFGGVAIICGWSSNGIGKGRNFKLWEVLIVPHGGSKNDTIVTVETKLEPSQKDFFQSGPKNNSP